MSNNDEEDELKKELFGKKGDYIYSPEMGGWYKPKVHGEHVSAVLYIVPLLFGFIGGTIMFVALQDINLEDAQNMFFAGLFSSILWFIFLWFAFFYA